MKYTVDGLSQDYLVSKQCDSTDVLLLSYLIWLMSNDTIKKKIVNNKVYHWINYDKVIEYMPILQLKKDSLYRRLTKLASKNILEHYTQKDSEGTYSYYRFNEDAHLSLIIDTRSMKNLTRTDEKQDGVGMEHRTKDNPIKDNPIYNNIYNQESSDDLKQKKIRKKKEFVPPTLQEVIDYKTAKGLDFDAEDFYSYYTNMDWKDKFGSPVLNWKSKILNVWCKNKKEHDKKQEVKDTKKPFDDPYVRMNEKYKQ